MAMVNNGGADDGGSGKRGNHELPKPKRVLYPRENIHIGWRNSPCQWQVGAGMKNMGNSCYLNSTLQALFHIPSMANWLMSEQPHIEQCETAEHGCIICSMAKTLQLAQTCSAAIRPKYIHSKLKQICKHLATRRQEDAHEFLRYLIDSMEKSYLSRFRNYKEMDQYTKETTPLNQIFGGYMRSAVRCLSCNHVSITFQHFQELLLDIFKVDTIDDALDGFFSRERLEDMGYKCESCNKKVSATKQFSIERAPIALCIQLKRFSEDGHKLNKHVAVKTRIDLARFATRKNTGELFTYKLVAMISHVGLTPHSGHYTAIGLTESGTYYYYDDSLVRSISIQNLCNTNAYIIFYELDTSVQRHLKNTTQVRRVDKKENMHIIATASKNSVIDEIFQKSNSNTNKNKNRKRFNELDHEDANECNKKQKFQQNKNSGNKNANESKSPLTNEKRIRPQFQRARSTPPSAPVVKTTSGLWQVEKLDTDELSDLDNSVLSNSFGASMTPPHTEATPVSLETLIDTQYVVKNPKNPFSANKTSKNENSNPGQNRLKVSHMTNGNAANRRNDKEVDNTKSNGVVGHMNGYAQGSVSNIFVNELLKQNHRGYGTNVNNWNGQASEMEKELLFFPVAGFKNSQFISFD